MLTGDVHVLLSEISYDCGKSLNPAVDMGQIEGAFIMGLGYILTERMEFDSSGTLLTNGTWVSRYRLHSMELVLDIVAILYYLIFFHSSSLICFALLMCAKSSCFSFNSTSAPNPSAPPLKSCFSLPLILSPRLTGIQAPTHPRHPQHIQRHHPTEYA